MDKQTLERFIEICREADIAISGITIPLEGYLQILRQQESYWNTTSVYLFFEEEGMNLFNPQYLLPLLGKMAETYIHHTVQLSDGDRGEVVMIHQQSLASPVVRVDNTFIDLAKSDALKIDAVL